MISYCITFNTLNMVTIVNVVERVSHDGNPFVSLILRGDLEIMTSANGNLYATAKKASLPCSLELESAKMLLGSQLPGKIEKVECESYEYANPETGEVLFLNHRYEYIPETSKVHQDERVMELFPVEKEVV